MSAGSARKKLRRTKLWVKHKIKRDRKTNYCNRRGGILYQTGCAWERKKEKKGERKDSMKIEPTQTSVIFYPLSLSTLFVQWLIVVHHVFIQNKNE